MEGSVRRWRACFQAGRRAECLRRKKARADNYTLNLYLAARTPSFAPLTAGGGASFETQQVGLHVSGREFSLKSLKSPTIPARRNRAPAAIVREVLWRCNVDRTASSDE